MSTPDPNEQWLEEEAVAHFTVDWVEDDLQKTPLVEVELIDENDVLPVAQRRATG